MPCANYFNVSPVYRRAFHHQQQVGLTMGHPSMKWMERIGRCGQINYRLTSSSQLIAVWFRWFLVDLFSIYPKVKSPSPPNTSHSRKTQPLVSYSLTHSFVRLDTTQNHLFGLEVQRQRRRRRMNGYGTEATFQLWLIMITGPTRQDRLCSLLPGCSAEYLFEWPETTHSHT